MSADPAQKRTRTRDARRVSRPTLARKLTSVPHLFPLLVCLLILFGAHGRTAAQGGTYATFLYQLHDTGEIWLFTGAPCSGGSCPGWLRLDNNPNSRAITVSDLFI
ncbi:MAG TPA: hypothetical protein VKB12_11410 [Pyrinomonadaceae bacterium]|nr:hypothetical protein [Pyrinomonadaceae bacterium]